MKIVLFSLLFLIACVNPTPVNLVRPYNKNVERGKYLVEGIAACGRCHAKPSNSIFLTGSHYFELDQEYYAPNITPAKSGIRERSLDQVFASIRSAKIDEDHYFENSAHKAYAWMSDQDIYAIIDYLNSLPALENTEDFDNSSIISKVIGGSGGTISKIDYVAAIKPSNQLAYGKYLVDSVADCGSCHNGTNFWGSTKYLQGGQIFKNNQIEIQTPGISADDLKNWTPQAIINYLKTGKKLNSKMIMANTCPTKFYSKASDQDLESIALYLKSLR